MTASAHPLLKTLYTLAVAAAAFTGFGNMPLWGRYYVSDIPGLGWSGDFIVNVNIHILAGSLLLGIGVYQLTGRLVTDDHRHGTLTLSGSLRGLLMALTLATGILMVVKNLPGIHFSLTTLLVFNFAHLGAAVLFILASLVALIFSQSWIRRR
jgi:hypothetical protein